MIPRLRPLAVSSLSTAWGIQPSAFSQIIAEQRLRIDAKEAKQDAKIPASPSAASAPRASLEMLQMDQDEKCYAVVNGVAVIPIIGALTKYSCWYYCNASMWELTQIINEAVDDPSVKTILLLIDSPGGEVAGVSDLADAIFYARRTKTVVAYVSDKACSCGYYLASQAEVIYCDYDATVGCIGVMVIVDDWSAFYEQSGIKVNVFRSAQFKNVGIVSGEPMNDAGRAEMQRHVEELHETFVAAIVRGRGVPQQTAAAWADGRVHVGRHALSLGLVDQIASYRDVLDELTRNQPAGRSS